MIDNFSPKGSWMLYFRSMPDWLSSRFEVVTIEEYDTPCGCHVRCEKCGNDETITESTDESAKGSEGPGVHDKDSGGL